MAGSQNHKLAAAVFKAGGLGSIPAAMLTNDSLQNELTAFRDALATENHKTTAWKEMLPVNVNFFCHTAPASQHEIEISWRLKLTQAYFRTLETSGYLGLGTLSESSSIQALNNAVMDTLLLSLKV